MYQSLRGASLGWAENLGGSYRKSEKGRSVAKSKGGGGVMGDPLWCLSI